MLKNLKTAFKECAALIQCCIVYGRKKTKYSFSQFLVIESSLACNQRNLCRNCVFVYNIDKYMYV